MRAAVRSRSRPFAQTPSLRVFPSERANPSEPERTPNLAILATDQAPTPDLARFSATRSHAFSGRPASTGRRPADNVSEPSERHSEHVPTARPFRAGTPPVKADDSVRRCAEMNKRASFGLLVVVVATVAIPAAARGGETGASEAIVYERKGDLYAVAVDGSRTVQLTKTGTLELEPAVSPDGRSIAYAAADRGSGPSGRLGRAYELWTMRVDGKRRMRLTRGFDSDPAWSRDGETILFSRAFENRYGDACRSILRIRKDGRGLRQVTRPDGRHSHWDAAVSPDGRRVAFTDEAGCESGASSFALRVVYASGRRTSDLSRLPGNAYSYSDPDHEDPTWSPDGSRIAFYRSNQRSPGVYVANRDGSGMRRVTPRRMEAAIEPAWSPDASVDRVRRPRRPLRDPSRRNGTAPAHADQGGRILPRMAAADANWVTHSAAAAASGGDEVSQVCQAGESHSQRPCAARSGGPRCRRRSLPKSPSHPPTDRGRWVAADTWKFVLQT